MSKIDVHIFCGSVLPKRFFMLCTAVAHWNELQVEPKVWVPEQLRAMTQSVLNVGCKATVGSYTVPMSDLSRDKFLMAKWSGSSDIICVADEDMLLCPVTRRVLLSQPNEWWEDYVLQQFEQIPDMNICAPIPQPKLHPSVFKQNSPVKSEAVGGISFIRRASIPYKLEVGTRLPSYDREICKQVGGAHYMPKLMAFHIGEWQSTIISQLNQEDPELYDGYAWSKKLGKISNG